jgi:act minimal PKS acyl carrier protein
MSRFALNDLTRMLRACAGEEEPGVLDGEILDRTFSDLGYDSVAVLEVISLIQREYDVQLHDETVTEAQTPRMMLDLVDSATVDPVV